MVKKIQRNVPQKLKERSFHNTAVEYSLWGRQLYSEHRGRTRGVRECETWGTTGLVFVTMARWRFSTGCNQLHSSCGPDVTVRQVNINTNKDINMSMRANTQAHACTQMSDKDRYMYTVRHACWYVPQVCRSWCKTMQISVIAVTLTCMNRHTIDLSLLPFALLMGCCLAHSSLFVRHFPYSLSRRLSYIHTLTQFINWHSASQDAKRMSFSVRQNSFFTRGGLESPLSAGSGCSKRSHASQAGGGGVAGMGISTTYCFPS